MGYQKFNYIETHLVHHCNLNCAGCTHYSPLAEPQFKNLDDYIKEIAKLATLTSQNLPMIRLLGGEPLLHPQVLGFCYITRKAFPNSDIELVTNGILLSQQTDSFFEKLNQWNIGIYLSDYNLSPHIREIVTTKVKKYRIGERPTLIKPAVHLHGIHTKEENFEKCKEIFRSPCYNLRDGYIYHCPTEAYFDFFLKYYSIELKDFKLEDNGINIFEASYEDIVQYLNTPSNFCKYCDMQEKMCDHKFCLSKRHMSEWVS